jgi:exopolysaccharide production protein ExoZ
VGGSQRPNSKLQSIQYLRGIAAMGVALTHASTSLFNGDSAIIPFTIGAAGVDLFFVISGFIMFYTTASDQVSPTEFYARRFIRIVPLYFALTTFCFALARVAPGALRSVSADPYDYFRSVLFVPFNNLKLGTVEPVLAQGWTLNYEMFFYLVFGACLLLTRTTRIVACFLIFLILSVIGSFLTSSNAVVHTYTDSLTMEFAFGMILGYVVTTRPQVLIVVVGGAVIATAAIALLQVRLPGVPLARFVAAGIPASAIVATALWLDRDGRVPHVPLLMLLGNASYSIYLTHGFSLGAMRRVWPMFFDSNLISTNAAFMGIGLVVTSAVGVAIFKYLESPVTEALNGRLRTRRRAPTT